MGGKILLSECNAVHSGWMLGFVIPFICALYLVHIHLKRLKNELYFKVTYEIFVVIRQQQRLNLLATTY